MKNPNNICWTKEQIRELTREEVKKMREQQDKLSAKLHEFIVDDIGDPYHGGKEDY